MGLFKSLINKLTKGYFYIVDERALRSHLERSLSFAVDEKLSLATEVNLFLDGEKHALQLFNNLANMDAPRPGCSVVYDEAEYPSIEELFDKALPRLPERFKIELPYCDDPQLVELDGAEQVEAE